jgi:hypothetical protein
MIIVAASDHTFRTDTAFIQIKHKSLHNLSVIVTLRPSIHKEPGSEKAASQILQGP